MAIHVERKAARVDFVNLHFSFGENANWSKEQPITQEEMTKNPLQNSTTSIPRSASIISHFIRIIEKKIQSEDG